MKNIIITGAAGFLGSVTTKTFLNKGYQVIAFVQDDEDAKKLQAHAALQTVVADLSDAQKVNAIISKLIDEKKQIDGCLLLAGGYTGGEIKDTGIDVIRQQISLNFETAYNVVHALFPHFKEKKQGRIVLTGAQPPLIPKKAVKALAYALSKSLLFQLAATLNEEAKGTNVVTNVIVPSTIDTAANRKFMPDADYSKWVKPEQIAETLEILCSDVSSSWREPVIKVYNNVV